MDILHINKFSLIIIAAGPNLYIYRYEVINNASALTFNFTIDLMLTLKFENIICLSYYNKILVIGDANQSFFVYKIK